MLNFAIGIILQGQSFISQLLFFLTLVKYSDQVFKLDPAAKADLAMWDEFLTNWNGISAVSISSVTLGGFCGHFLSATDSPYLGPQKSS